MTAHDPERRLERETAADRPGPAGPCGPTGPAHRYLWALALVAGAVAGAASWAAGETIVGRFSFSATTLELPENWDRMGQTEKEAFFIESERALRPMAEAKNAAAAFGLLGAALGVSLGLLGGLARRAPAAGARAAAIGLVAGAAAAAAGSFVMSPLFYRFLEPDSGLLLPTVTHGVIWAAVGAAGGLALGLGLGDRRRLGAIVFGGVLGALCGTVAFEVINAIAFPTLRVEQPVPGESGARMAAHLSVAIAVALGAALGRNARVELKRPRPSPPTGGADRPDRGGEGA